MQFSSPSQSNTPCLLLSNLMSKTALPYTLHRPPTLILMPPILPRIIPVSRPRILQHNINKQSLFLPEDILILLPARLTIISIIHFSLRSRATIAMDRANICLVNIYKMLANSQGITH